MSWIRASLPFFPMQAGWGLLFAAGLRAGPVREITLTNLRDPGAALLQADLPALRRTLQGFENQADTEAMRSTIADTVLEHYQAAGWPVTEVEVTPQAEGRLDVGIREGRYGQIAVDGSTAWVRQAIAASWQNRPGAPLTMEDVLDALAWIHRNPLHAVTASFSPGAEPATADTILTVHSPAPLRFFSGWRNDGIESLGKDRYSAGIELADPAGLPLWFSAELLSGEDLDAYHAARSTLRLFLPWEHELRFSGQWTQGKTDGVVPGFTSSSEVEAWYISSRYLIPLPGWRGWRTDFGAGADFFRTTSGVAVEDLSVAGTADALQLTLEANATRSAGQHTSGIHVEAVWSPGGITDHADDADHTALRNGASADYFLSRVQAWHRYEFASGWSLTGQTAGQWTSAPVLPMQSFSPAGANAVRGYPEASVLGDHGVQGGLEIAAPALRPLSAAPDFSLQPVSFIEAGWVRDAVSGDESTLAGAGLGLRLRWNRHALLAADYGWRLNEPGGRAHLALRLEF